MRQPGPNLWGMARLCGLADGDDALASAGLGERAEWVDHGSAG